MGTKADDIERQIEELRVDTDRLLDEVERRLREAINIRAQAEHHPIITTTITLSIVMTLALLAYNIFFRPRFAAPVRAIKRQREQGMFGRLTELGGKTISMAKTAAATLSKD